MVTISADSVSPVGYLRPTEFHVEPKGEGAVGPGDVRMMPDKWIPRRSDAFAKMCIECGGGSVGEWLEGVVGPGVVRMMPMPNKWISRR